MVLATTRLTEFLPYVEPHVAQCPRPTMERALRMSAIELCEKARVWRHNITATLTVAQNVALVAPAYSAIQEIEAATHNGNLLTPLAYLDADPDELTGIASTGKPEFISQQSLDTVAVYPFAAGTLRLSVFLKPRLGQLYGTDAADPLHDAYNMVPDFMLAHHAETLAHGALARLMAVPNQVWTNPSLAGFYMQSFGDRCNAAKVSAIKGQQRAPLRTKARWM